MQFRRAIMIAAIVLWPIAVEVSQRLAPKTAAITGALVISSFIFYIGCTVLLRSSTITGTLSGIVAWLTVEASYGIPIAVQSVAKPVFYAAVGAVMGLLWEFSRGSVRRV